jgi:hypothetical protein
VPKALRLRPRATLRYALVSTIRSVEVIEYASHSPSPSSELLPVMDGSALTNDLRNAKASKIMPVSDRLYHQIFLILLEGKVELINYLPNYDVYSDLIKDSMRASVH